MRYFLVILLLLVALPVQAQPSAERECGQHLDPVTRVPVAATCIERDFNQALASCRTCQNLAYAGILAGFTGLAHNINGDNTDQYHLWQYLGQTSAAYLLYTTNTSRGGLLRAWGLIWTTNALFQSVVNRAAGLCGDGGICWTDAEEATWDLEGVAIPKLWHGGARRVQFGLGVALIATGLTIDIIDHVAPQTGRTLSVEAHPNSVALRLEW